MSKPFSRLAAYRLMLKTYYSSAPGLVTVGTFASALLVALATTLVPPVWSVPAFMILTMPLWLLLTAYLYSRALFVAGQAKPASGSALSQEGQRPAESPREASAATKLLEQRALLVLAEVDEAMKRAQENSLKIEGLEDSLARMEEDLSAIDLRSADVQRHYQKLLSDIEELTKEIPGFLDRLIDLRSRVLRLESPDEGDQPRA